MNRKYQVFISSTYEDLKEERKSIIDILLTADCIPAGMEAFCATDDEQFNVIKKVIDLCDYYILIIGNRYGSINETTGKSYTQMEYEYAKSKRIPVLVFAVENSAYPSDNEPEKADKLARFKKIAMQNRLASVWNDVTTLGPKIAIAIMKIRETQPRPGWIRAQEIVSSESKRIEHDVNVNIPVASTYKSLKKSNPAQFKLILLYNDKPIKEASVTLIAKNATCIAGKTNDGGIAEMQIPTSHDYSLLLTHPEFPAYIVKELDTSNDLQICFSNKNSWGSIICHSTCYLPGLSGRLNLILDTGNRTYLYADNISFDNKTLQPFSFKIDNPFILEDCLGNAFEVVVIFIHGRTSVLNYKRLNE